MKKSWGQLLRQAMNLVLDHLILTPKERTQAAAERRQSPESVEVLQVEHSEAPWMYVRPPQK